MKQLKRITQMRLFLPIFSMFLVMAVNIVFDLSKGNVFYNFFTITIKNGVLYGRLVDILNRGSEAAILAIGMTLVVSASAGADISVGSVMSLAGGMCCMLLAGFGNVNVSQYAVPLWVGIAAGILVACLCGAFNGFLVSYMNIQPMVATLILFSAGRAIGLLLCNSMIVYIRVPSFRVFGADLKVHGAGHVCAECGHQRQGRPYRGLPVQAHYLYGFCHQRFVRGHRRTCGHQPHLLG